MVIFSGLPHGIKIYVEVKTVLLCLIDFDYKYGVYHILAFLCGQITLFERLLNVNGFHFI